MQLEDSDAEGEEDGGMDREKIANQLFDGDDVSDSVETMMQWLIYVWISHNATTAFIKKKQLKFSFDNFYKINHSKMLYCDNNLFVYYFCYMC